MFGIDYCDLSILQWCAISSSAEDTQVLRQSAEIPHLECPI